MKPEICPLFKNRAEFRKIEDFEGSELYQCFDCGVQFWWPLPKSSDKEFYQESKMYEFVEKRPLAWYHKQFLNSPPLNSGRLLDVGFGQGEFLNAARSLNLDLWGVDIAERNVEIAKRSYNLQNIYAYPLDEFIKQKDAGKFDLVTAFELLEHLPDPAGFLDLTKKILKNGGYLIISTPNLRRFGGVKEDWDFPPNHLFRWDQNVLVKLLEAKGFRVVKVVEQPFTRDFFFIRGTLSFGLMKFLRVKSGKVVKRGLGPVRVVDRENKALSKLIILEEYLVCLPGPKIFC
jgi:2-polyprenyl-3-methyl-5-hydroxy-6-metoxy-1,4-benzoquinol methylase